MRFFFAIGVLLLPAVLWAAEPVAPETKFLPVKKFMPLDKVRGASSANNQNLQAPTPKPYVLRADKDALGASMRIDRARSIPIEPQRALMVKSEQDVGVDKKNAGSSSENAALAQGNAATAIPGAETLEPESEEIEGNTETINPVLALFDSDGAAVASSFKEAMLGARARTLVGAARHLIWPIPLAVKQHISSGYGMRSDPFHGRPTFHGGIDIAAAPGTMVLATADGVVEEVKMDANYGKYITIKHADGTLSRYGHLKTQMVTQGQNVKGGEAIGTVGMTGRATGPHLDYRVSRNGEKFDPLAILAVPSAVPMSGIKPPLPLAASRATRAGVATNAVAKRAMVIEVR